MTCIKIKSTREAVFKEVPYQGKKKKKKKPGQKKYMLLDTSILDHKGITLVIPENSMNELKAVGVISTTCFQIQNIV